MEREEDRPEVKEAKLGVASRRKKCAGAVFPISLRRIFEKSAIGVFEHDQAGGEVAVWVEVGGGSGGVGHDSEGGLFGRGWFGALR